MNDERRSYWVKPWFKTLGGSGFSFKGTGRITQTENQRESHKLKTEFLHEFVIPIPSFAEQHRIVVKVDQLMALVDELETQLATSRATAKNLLESLVAELTAV